jgi:hypothetical protein
MGFFLLVIFLGSIIEIGKYMVLFFIKFLSNPPQKILITTNDEIVIVTSVSYFLSYILY